jgi:hypothetical protein
MLQLNTDPNRVARDLALWRRGEFAAGLPGIFRRWRIRRLMQAVSRNNRHDLDRRIAAQQVATACRHEPVPRAAPVDHRSG